MQFFYGLQFGIKYLVKSFDLKVEPGGVKVLQHPIYMLKHVHKKLTQGQFKIVSYLLTNLCRRDANLNSTDG